MERLRYLETPSPKWDIYTKTLSSGLRKVFGGRDGKILRASGDGRQRKQCLSDITGLMHLGNWSSIHRACMGLTLMGFQH